MKKKSTSQSAYFNLRILIGALFCLGAVAVALAGTGVFAQTKSTRQSNRSSGGSAAPGTQTPDVQRLIGPVRLGKRLSEIPFVPGEPKAIHEPLTRYPRPKTGAPPEVSFPKSLALLGRIFRAIPNMPPPLLTFDGIDEAEGQCNCVPPDTIGDVGPNHYVETTNVAIKVFDKDGNTVSGPITFDSFFADLGPSTPCGNNQNNGDPFVFYDHMADRWIISDFAFPTPGGVPAAPFYECIGVSTSGDPAGTYNLYAVQHEPTQPTWLGDYPKMAMWNSGGNPAQDAYFLSVNLFEFPSQAFKGVRVTAFDREAMINGDPNPTAVSFTLSDVDVGASYSFVVAGFRTGDPPPTGRDAFVLAIDSPSTGGVTLTQVHGRLFHVDFDNPGNSTFGVGPTHQPNTEITVNGFIDAFTLAAGFTIVPQSGTSQRIDTLGDKIMTPVVYYNDGGTESLWSSNTVCTDAPCTQPTGIRWYQFDVTGGTFAATPVQQQTWTNNNDGLYRFMSSIAVDNAGNAAIGYSVSSSAIFPGIRYAGRLAGDPLNDLGQGEGTMFNGLGSESDSFGRWGDYSMTTVDPSDGMTFYHANEYYPSTSSFNYATRIGKFNFVGGGGTPTPTPTATPSSCSWAAGPNLPSIGVRQAGVYFPANGKFYSMGGRSSDDPGSEFTNPFEYDPGTNSWTTKSGVYPDTQVNNIACGVLNEAGTDYIYCVGGSDVASQTTTGRVFRYNPVTDTISSVPADWPGANSGTTLPGGFAVVSNKFYIMGGFQINTQMVNQTWEFDPAALTWTQKANMPVARGYIPAAAIGTDIYTAGGSTCTKCQTDLADTNDSFKYDTIADAWTAITNIPRITGETRALTFCNKVYVMGGGRTPPNPSNEVDVYDPDTDTWSTDLPFVMARRNFATNTDGTNNIWLAGGYGPTDSMEIFNCPISPCGTPSPSPTPTATATATPSITPSATPSATPTATATPGGRPTPTPRPRPTPHPRP